MKKKKKKDLGLYLRCSSGGCKAALVHSCFSPSEHQLMNLETWAGCSLNCGAWIHPGLHPTVWAEKQWAPLCLQKAVDRPKAGG